MTNNPPDAASAPPPPSPSPYTVDARIAALQETITVLTERLTRLEGELAALRRWITARVEPPVGRSRP